MRYFCNIVGLRACELRGLFWRDTRGAAAIEFGILAPLLLLMLLGTIEIGRAVSTDRHFNSATSTAGDLVAREEYLGTNSSAAQSNLASMMLSIQHLMAPYDPTTLKLTVMSVRASTTDAKDTKVSWAYSFNGAAKPANCSAYALPTDLIGKGGSVIVVDATYGFTTLFGDFVPGMAPTMTWNDKTFHSPRNSCVDYVKGDNCTNSC
jgi:Flp pilus assembly protein TadG